MGWLQKFCKRNAEEEKKSPQDTEVPEAPSPAFLMQQRYMEFFELPVDKKCILLESLQGKTFSHSMQVLAKALHRQPEFQTDTVYVVCTPENVEERKDYFRWSGLSGFRTVLYATEEYNRLLATAGVLVNENSFQNHFIKKAEQIYIRVWNGVPMKQGGRYMDSDYAGIGNVQRNLLCADYLVCPNAFVLNCLADNYMLSNIGKTKVLLAGRFQNEILFDHVAAEELRHRQGLEGKQVLLYVPNLRGSADSETEIAKMASLQECLVRMDGYLTKEQKLYVSIPPQRKDYFDFASLQHVAVVPGNYSLPQFLAVSDMLITDCSDVVFDFAATRRKIVLFSFDHNEAAMEQYYSLHGDLPFVRVASVEQLAKEWKTGGEYREEAFFRAYGQYHKPGMAEAVLRRALLGEVSPELIETTLPDNGKKNVIIYPGPLFKNGITSSILSLLEHLDRKKNNYILFFRTEHVQQVAETLKSLPEGVAYYGYTNVAGVTEKERIIYDAWLHDKNFSYETAKPVLYGRMEREKQRLLSFCRIDTVIHYEGYGRDMLLLFELMPCRRIIYLHNNMLKEVEKKDIRPELLCHAYSTYDTVALVSEEQREVAEQMAAMSGENGKKANIVLAKNVIPYEQVRKRSMEEFRVDQKTEMNVTEKQLKHMLASGKKKFVTIGRFLPEKGHERLIHAFEQVHRQHPDTCLVILGGYGPLYEDTLRWAAQSRAAEDIAVMKYLSNPYALLKCCDYFILSSYYEGLPVVLTEADIAGLPCVSTAIPGPKKMMEQYGGLLVEDSEQGIVEGMLKCLSGEAPERFRIDYPEYNREAIRQFEAMLS